MLLKMVAHSLVFTVLLALLLFLPAGAMAWPQAWVCMALFIGCSEAMGVWLAKSDPDHTAQDTSWKGSATFISGTGKFAGVTGNVSYVNHGHEFRPLAEGTYVNYVTLDGSYKLP